MFQRHGKLDHVLAPSAYSSADFFAREQEAIFRRRWHYVGLASQLANAGDFLARELAGEPVLVRNDGGEIRAFKNVCAHRHSMLVPLGAGRSERMTCQYHGWEYDPNGRVRRIPDGKSFKGIKPDQLCLGRYAVEQLAGLVFVHLSDGEGVTPLREEIAELAGELEHFYGDHRLVWEMAEEHPVNWKVIAENAVESYHVPMIHPGTFTDYKDEAHHDHRITATFTSYLDVAPMSWSLTDTGFRALTTLLVRDVRFPRAKHVHVFPALLLDYREVLSLISVLEPLGPERTRIRTLALVPNDVRIPLVTRQIQRLFTAAMTPMVRKIMSEDTGIWRYTHRGLKASTQSGVLGCREERVHAFQQWVSGAVGGDP